MKSGNEVALEIVKAGLVRAAEIMNDQFELALAKCESPIEKIFAAQLVHPDTAREYDTLVTFMFPPSGLVAHAVPPPETGFWVYPQIQIGKYRVDFLIISNFTDVQTQLVIELDGHEFHERTKFQAMRDKSRDRWLVGQGYKVLRFTGSEVYRNPPATVAETLEIAAGISV